MYQWVRVVSEVGHGVVPSSGITSPRLSPPRIVGWDVPRQLIELLQKSFRDRIEGLFKFLTIEKMTMNFAQFQRLSKQKFKRRTGMTSQAFYVRSQ